MGYQRHEFFKIIGYLMVVWDEQINLYEYFSKLLMASNFVVMFYKVPRI